MMISTDILILGNTKTATLLGKQLQRAGKGYLIVDQDKRPKTLGRGLVVYGSRILRMALGVKNDFILTDDSGKAFQAPILLIANREAQQYITMIEDIVGKQAAHQDSGLFFLDKEQDEPALRLQVKHLLLLLKERVQPDESTPTLYELVANPTLDWQTQVAYPVTGYQNPTDDQAFCA